jgi:hypothetical protein
MFRDESVIAIGWEELDINPVTVDENGLCSWSASMFVGFGTTEPNRP